MHSIWNFHRKVLLYTFALLKDFITYFREGYSDKPRINKTCVIWINSYVDSKIIEPGYVTVI